jgi:hypothetical protein
MGREINKRTCEYHNPVHMMKKIPSGGFMYCHWHGRVGRTNKWTYSVADPKKYQMDQIKGVLKDPLKAMTVPKADRNKYEKDEPPMQLSMDDLNTWEELQAKAHKEYAV